MVAFPEVSLFAHLSEINPSTDNKCIYLVKGEDGPRRCKNFTNKPERQRAIEIHREINRSTSSIADLGLLEEYALNSCCTRAKHRDKIVDIGLVGPLAERWQAEIWDRTNESRSAATVDQSLFIPIENHARYDLRLRETTVAVLSQRSIVPRPPLSEFRPHIETPGPGDSVYAKLLAPLIERDFETGSLYIFDRSSSPGYVKIGWTASTVLSRLRSWASCGYIPNLLFSSSSVPHAQRVETLIHYELIVAWRRERMCKAPHCLKSHQEWFEIAKEKAEEVVGYWVEFLRNAKPYDALGRLKSRWVTMVKMMHREKVAITGKRLLQYYEESLAVESMLTKNSPTMVKVEEEGLRADEPNVLPISAFSEAKETLRHAGSLESSILLKDELLVENHSLHEPSVPVNDVVSQAKISTAIEPAVDEVSAFQTTDVEDEIDPEQVPLPPSPIIDPQESSENLLPFSTTEPSSIILVEQSSAPKTTHPPPKLAVAGDSSDLDPRISISSSNNPTEAAIHQANCRVDDNTDTASLRCNSANCSSRLTLPLVPVTPTTEEGERNIEPCKSSGGQVVEAEDPSNHYESVVIEDGTGSAAVEWSENEQTLVEDLKVEDLLEKSVLKIVDQLCNEMPVGSTDLRVTGPDITAEVAVPVVELVAQA